MEPAQLRSTHGHDGDAYQVAALESEIEHSFQVFNATYLQHFSWAKQRFGTGA
jgi:hypothetical protein